MKKLFLIVYVVLFSLSLQASELKSREDVEAFYNLAIELIGQGKIVEALNTFRPHLIIPETEFDLSVEQFTMQQPVIDQRFGRTIGAELLHVKPLGDSLLRVVILQKFERHAMHWKLYFYKPSDHWILNTYLSDDSVEALFHFDP
ncbi:MAG: hypothetical protein AAF446_06935 [Pseudomonadota bacterium]